MSRSLDDEDEDPDDLGSDDSDSRSSKIKQKDVTQKQSESRISEVDRKRLTSQASDVSSTTKLTKKKAKIGVLPKRILTKGSSKHTTKPATKLHGRHLLNQTRNMQPRLFTTKSITKKDANLPSKGVASSTTRSVSKKKTFKMNSNDKLVARHSSSAAKPSKRVGPSKAKNTTKVKPTAKVPKAAAPRRRAQRIQTEGYSKIKHNVKHLKQTTETIAVRKTIGVKSELLKIGNANKENGSKRPNTHNKWYIPRLVEGIGEGNSQGDEGSATGYDDISGDHRYSGREQEFSGEDEDFSGEGEDDVSGDYKGLSGSGKGLSGDGNDLMEDAKVLSGDGLSEHHWSEADKSFSGYDNDLSGDAEDSSGDSEDLSGDEKGFKADSVDPRRINHNVIKPQKYLGKHKDSQTGKKIDLVKELEELGSDEDDNNQSNKQYSKLASRKISKVPRVISAISKPDKKIRKEGMKSKTIQFDLKQSYKKKGQQSSKMPSKARSSRLNGENRHRTYPNIGTGHGKSSFKHRSSTTRPASSTPLQHRANYRNGIVRKENHDNKANKVRVNLNLKTKKDDVRKVKYTSRKGGGKARIPDEHKQPKMIKSVHTTTKHTKPSVVGNPPDRHTKANAKVRGTGIRQTHIIGTQNGTGKHDVAIPRLKVDKTSANVTVKQNISTKSLSGKGPKVISSSHLGKAKVSQKGQHATAVSPKRKSETVKYRAKQTKFHDGNSKSNSKLEGSTVKGYQSTNQKKRKSLEPGKFQESRNLQSKEKHLKNKHKKPTMLGTERGGQKETKIMFPTVNSTIENIGDLMHYAHRKVSVRHKTPMNNNTGRYVPTSKRKTLTRTTTHQLEAIAPKEGNEKYTSSQKVTVQRKLPNNHPKPNALKKEQKLMHGRKAPSLHPATKSLKKKDQGKLAVKKSLTNTRTVHNHHGLILSSTKGSLSSKENRSLASHFMVSPHHSINTTETKSSPQIHTSLNNALLSIKQRSNSNISDTKSGVLAHFLQDSGSSDGIDFSVKTSKKHHKRREKHPGTIDVEDLGDADFDIMMSNDIPHKDLPKKSKGKDHKHTTKSSKKHDKKHDNNEEEKKEENDNTYVKDEDDDAEESEKSSSTRHSSHSKKDQSEATKKSKKRGHHHHHHHEENTDTDEGDEQQSSKDEDDRRNAERKSHHHHKKHNKPDNVPQKDDDHENRHQNTHKNRAHHNEKARKEDDDDDNNEESKHTKHHHAKQDDSRSDRSENEHQKKRHHHHHKHKEHSEKPKINYDDNHWEGKVIPGTVKITYEKDSGKKRHHHHHNHNIQDDDDNSEVKEKHHKRKHSLKAHESDSDSDEETKNRKLHRHSKEKTVDNHDSEDGDESDEKRTKHREDTHRKKHIIEEEESAEKRTDVNYEVVKKGRHRVTHDEDNDNDSNESSERNHEDKDDDSEEKQDSDNKSEEDKSNGDNHSDDSENTKNNRVVLGEDSESDEQDEDKHTEESHRNHNEHGHPNEHKDGEREDDGHEEDDYESKKHEEYHKSDFQHKHWESRRKHYKSHLKSKEDNDDNSDHVVSDEDNNFKHGRRNFRKSFMYHRGRKKQWRQYHEGEENSEDNNNDHQERKFQSSHQYHHYHHRPPDWNDDRTTVKYMEHHEPKETYVLDSSRNKEEEHGRSREHNAEQINDYEKQREEPEEVRFRGSMEERRPYVESEEQKYKHFYHEKERHHFFHEDDREEWKNKGDFQGRKYENGDAPYRPGQTYEHRFMSSDEKPNEDNRDHRTYYYQGPRHKPRHRKKWHKKNRYHFYEKDYPDFEGTGGPFDSSAWMRGDNSDDGDDHYYGGEGNQEYYRRKHHKHKHRKHRQSYDYWGYRTQNPYYYDYNYHKSRPPYEYYKPKPAFRPRSEWRKEHYGGYARWKPKPSSWYQDNGDWNRKSLWQPFQENTPKGYQWNTFDNNHRMPPKPKPTPYAEDPSHRWRPPNPQWQQPDQTQQSFGGDNWSSDHDPDQGHVEGPAQSQRQYNDWSKNGPPPPLKQGGYGPQKNPVVSGPQPWSNVNASKPGGGQQSAGVQSKYVPPAQQTSIGVVNQTRFRPTVRRQYPAGPSSQVPSPTKINQIKNIMDKLNTPPSSTGVQQAKTVPTVHQGPVQNTPNKKDGIPKTNLTASDQMKDRNRLNGFFNEENKGKKKSEILLPANRSDHQQAGKNSSSQGKISFTFVVVLPSEKKAASRMA